MDFHVLIRPLHTCFIISTVLYFGACTSPPESGDALGRTQQRINDGQLETGQDSVVLLYHTQEGVMCTGTIIGQRVVLTAKHCVRPNTGAGPGEYSPSGWTINIGPNMNQIYNQYGVSEVRYPPGTQVDDNDIAVLIVNGVMSEPPYALHGALTSVFINSSVYLIGYGVDSCNNGNSGTKYRTTDHVSQFYLQNSFITLGQGANQGDSGGPVFNTSYEVVGVMVAMGGNCSEGVTICTRIDRFADLISTALDDTGGCYPTGEEVCGDGIDNDCQNGIDDGCSATGEPCAVDGDCASGFCTNLGQGLVCAQLCSPQSPYTGCVAGYYCKEIDCARGACVPGTAGGGAFGALCTSDIECQSLYCKPAGDGAWYCGERCAPDQGECLPAEVCAPMGVGCGACQYGSTYQGLRGLGEVCQANAACLSGLCLEDTGAYYCSRTCSGNSDCPDDFHCRNGYCVRGPSGIDGDPCVNNDDCTAPLMCYSNGADAYCTQLGCDSPSVICPTYMECTDSGGMWVCALAQSPVGSRCASNGNCLSGGCLGFDNEFFCTLTCDRDTPCPTGTFCTLSDSGMLACAPNSVPPELTPPIDPPAAKGGCSTTAGSSGWCLGLLGLLLIGLRRRRR